jgi:hypothetical protein
MDLTPRVECGSSCSLDKEGDDLMAHHAIDHIVR